MEENVIVEESEELSAQLIAASLAAQQNLNAEDTQKYLCETCGREDELTEAEAYRIGWDYPPFIGVWGIVSPRTCPNCLIDTTAYWFLMNRKAEDPEPIPERHMNTLKRIMAEPEEHGVANP